MSKLIRRAASAAAEIAADRTLGKMSEAGAGSTSGYRRVLEQLLDVSDEGFSNATLQRAFELARRRDPALTPAGFLAAAPLALQRVARHLMGEASFVMETTSSPSAFWQALADAVADLRRVLPPNDAGFSYPLWDRVRNIQDHLDGLPTRNDGTLPINAPVRVRGRPELVVYPGWGTGQERAIRFAGVVLLSHGHRLIRRSPGQGAKGLRAAYDDLGDRINAELPAIYGPELRLTGWDAAFMMQTGYAPIYAGRVGAFPSGVGSFTKNTERNALQAHWSLARRFDDPGLLDKTPEELEAWLETLSDADKRRIPHNASPFGDPFLRLPPEQLVAHVNKRATGGALVWYSVFELEHHLGQRTGKALDRLFSALKIDVAYKGELRRLTGLCEPENVHLVSPFMHAQMDVYAHLNYGALRAGHLSVNGRRMDRFGNVLLDTRHSDLARGMNGFIGARRFHLEQLVDLLSQPEVAAAGSSNEWTRSLYQALAQNVNSAIDFNGYSIAARVPTDL